MKYKLEDLIDIPLFQSLQEKLYLISPFATGIVDNEGKILTAVAWQDLCVNFYRKHPVCEKECIKSDQYILEHLHEANPSVSYQCPHGLIDNATPIIIEGNHLANFFIGQFFFEKPDLEIYRQQARKFGFDEESFLEAVKRVPVWTREQLLQRLSFIKELIEILAVAGLKRLKEFEINNALQESEEKFRLLSENSGTGIYIIQDGKVAYSNPILAKMFGYAKDEITGKMTIKDFIHPDDLPIAIKRAQERLAGKTQTDPFQYKAKKKDGSAFYIEIYGMSINYHSKPAIMGTIIDITEQTLAREELINAKERAEKSDQLKTAFLHNISHEIRTPLNAIMGFTELLRNSNYDDAKRKHLTGIILSSADQLLDIVDDILAISRVDAGLESINNAEVNINELCKKLYLQYKSKAPHNVEFTLNPGLPEIKAFINTDKTKLFHILNNLLSNAFKFTVNGAVEFGYTVTPDLAFYVKDTGIGIPQNFMNEIFERFRQVDNTERRRYGGSGLGLSIAKAYAELLGGKIWATSEEGKGSVFYFTIPIRQRKNTGAVNDSPDSGSKISIPRGLNILIAEDEESNYMLLKEFLMVSEPNIFWAKNGLEAVELCASKTSMQLILMDLKMPVMNGFEATRQIRELFPGIPVLGLSAYSASEDIAKAQDAGCNDILSKPVRKELLLHKINQLLHTFA